MVSDPPAAEDVLMLFESLPGEAPSRGVASEGSKSWTTGAYAQGNFRGLRTNTHLFPSCTEVMCRFLRQRAPHRTFAAIAIRYLSEFTVWASQGRQQRWGFFNILFPLTEFQGGGVWIEHDNGDVQAPDNSTSRGTVMSVFPGPCFLDAQKSHATMPWTGRRVLLVGFTPKGAWEEGTRAQTLLDLGFVPPAD